MATIRITGVPTTTTKHDITKSLRARSDCVSLSHHDSHPTSSQTATVTFTSRSTAARLKATKRPPRCLGRRPSVDSDFLGLTVLSSSPDDEVDIVAVHGLNGHAFDTWTTGDRMWLRDFLPHQLTRTRIMTYGYNSNVWDKLSTTTIPEFALALLSALVNKRGTKDKKRPIIFVCHSLGGIVVKLALNLARKDKHTACIAAAARGVVFLATPHRGSDTANNVVVGTLAKVLAVRQDLLIALRMDSRQLNEIDNEFRTNYENLDIATFYETKKTKLSRVVSSFDRVIVERSSATLQGKGPHFPIERDHRGICKFLSSHEDDYKAVYMQIARMVKKAKVTVAARVVLKALHLPQLGEIFKLGGKEMVKRYGEAWTAEMGVPQR